MKNDKRSDEFGVWRSLVAHLLWEHDFCDRHGARSRRVAAPAAVWAADDAATELAKKTQYPVADLISVPFQNNFYFNSGPKDATV